MENEHVLSGLHRKRAEVVAKLATVQAEAFGLAKALESIEATIRVFSPDVVLPVVKVNLVPRQRIGYHGELSRPMLGALRDAVAPVATRALTLKVMEARGYDASDERLVRAVHKRVNGSLREMRNRGIVKSEQRDDGQIWWWIA